MGCNPQKTKPEREKKASLAFQNKQNEKKSVWGSSGWRSSDCGSSVAALSYENVVETGSETEEDDKLPVSEEDPLLNGTGSPASLTNPEASPRAESHGLLTKDEEDDEMRDSGVEHIWPDNDMLSASVDGTGE